MTKNDFRRLANRSKLCAEKWLAFAKRSTYADQRSRALKAYYNNIRDFHKYSKLGA